MTTPAAPRASSLLTPGRVLLYAGLAAVGIAFVIEADYWLKPGFGEVVRGLAHHAFVLAWLVVVTWWTRTVSLAQVGTWWLIGVFVVFSSALVVEWPFANALGADSEVIPTVIGPLIEEAAKFSAVAILLWLVLRPAGRHPSASDGLLIGFIVGAGISFNEDALIGQVNLSGLGFKAMPPWSYPFPVVSPVGDFIALNHALWGALSGAFLGLAVLLRHIRLAWLLGLAGPILAVTNHMASNYFGSHPFQALGREDAPIQWAMVRTLTLDGALPLAALLGAIVAIVALEWRILRSTATPVFPGLSGGAQRALVTGLGAPGGRGRSVAGATYVRLRRSLFYAVWHARRRGRLPDIPGEPLDRLAVLGARAGVVWTDLEPSAAVEAQAGPTSG